MPNMTKGPPLANIVFRKKLPGGEFLTYSKRPSESFLELEQVHGNKIITFDKNQKSFPPKGDGIIVARTKKIKMAIQSADCMPVLAVGPKSLCFLHVGHQGLSKGILESKDFAKIRPFFFYIGPSISVHSYEVSADFKNHFPQSARFVSSNKKLYFDLQREAFDRLRKCFPLASVVYCGVCTHKNLKFHSYRREKGKERNWNIFNPN